MHAHTHTCIDNSLSFPSFPHFLFPFLFVLLLRLPFCRLLSFIIQLTFSDRFQPTLSLISTSFELATRLSLSRYTILINAHRYLPSSSLSLSSSLHPSLSLSLSLSVLDIVRLSFLNKDCSQFLTTTVSNFTRLLHDLSW